MGIISFINQRSHHITGGGPSCSVTGPGNTKWDKPKSNDPPGTRPGKRLQFANWKPRPIEMDGLPMKNGYIFYSHVSLPEGIPFWNRSLPSSITSLKISHSQYETQGLNF